MQIQDSHFSDIAFGDAADAAIIRADGSYVNQGVAVDLSGISGGIGVGGTFHVECYDNKGKLRWVDDAKNAVSLPALDYVLNTCLNNGTPIALFYVGLVDNAGFTAYSTADTLAAHGGWSENTQYTGTRQAWTQGASSGQSITNAVPLSFAMVPSVGSPATIRGLLLASHTSSSSSTFLLFSTASFSQGNQTVNNGDTLKVTYTISATSS
jgi:hypothetical protein